MSIDLNLTVVEQFQDFATLYGKSITGDDVCILLVVNQPYCKKEGVSYFEKNMTVIAIIIATTWGYFDTKDQREEWRVHSKHFKRDI